MSEMTIDEATRDASVGGGELVPVSDAGTPKSMSVSQIKDYVLARIAALDAADGVSVSYDSVYILKGGALKPVTAANLAVERSLRLGADWLLTATGGFGLRYVGG